MIYTARVRIQQDIANPRGPGVAVMSHHAELPNDLAAEQWATDVADNAQNGVFGQRWLADRSGEQVHVVEVFRRSIEDRTTYTPVARVTFSLDGRGLGLEIPLPLPGVEIAWSSETLRADPTASLLVIERGYAGTTQVGRRCYVGPIAPVQSVGRITVSLIGAYEGGYLMLPGTTNDDPSEAWEQQGWWSEEIAEAGCEYLRGMHERADALGGNGAVVSWLNATASETTSWRASRVPARMRSRATNTTMSPDVT